MIAQLLSDLRRRWPDAPTELLEAVAARALLLAVVKHWNRAVSAFDDEAQRFARACQLSPETKIDRLMIAAEVERARFVTIAWAELVALAARLLASKRARYGLWLARRQRRAELRGEPLPPAYVLPEHRGDAWESHAAAIPSVFLLGARATLRIWSRYYAMHKVNP